MDNFTFVIFGVTGNLAQLKLIPAIYDLVAAGLMPPHFTILGLGRTPMSDDEYSKYFIDVLHKPNHHHVHPIDPAVLFKLQPNLKYLAGDMSDPGYYAVLKQFLDASPNGTNRVYYLAVYPQLQPVVFQRLEDRGLNKTDSGWVRVVIEKPIGTDLTSAKELNALLSKYYVEDQIFRLDHYLGRQTLQNLLTFRFGNGIFEPLINKDYIDHIQITAAEEFGVGQRGGYYDSVGCLKDVGQNHLLQMLALSAMDAPQDFTNPSITQKRIGLISSLVPDPKKIVFGQYNSYLQEPNIPAQSPADTYFALKTTINSDRFKNVPIYIRAGKKLARTVTEVAIVFKNRSGRLFSHNYGGQEPNILIYRIQPNEGIVLRILTKAPGFDIKLEETYMQFCYRHLKSDLPDPYLRLIEDVLRGDQTFFNDAPEVEAQWRFTDPLIASRTTPQIYEPGSWGPADADALMAADGRSWIEPSIAFCTL